MRLACGISSAVFAVVAFASMHLPEALWQDTAGFAGLAVLMAVMAVFSGRQNGQ